MRRKSPHILCFAPYTDWSIHSAREVTILQALRQRECTVTYVTCDGVFSDCDLLQASTGAPGQKPAHACLFCQARVATRLAGWGMPFRWLGQWLSTDDRRRAAGWVGGLSPGGYTAAHYDDWPIGAWVKSSVHRHFRHNTLDLTDANVSATYGSYLYSGALAAIALDRIFNEEKPDIQLLFNGRMAPTRIALELARRRGVRTICEERSYVPGRVQLFDDVNCLDLTAINDLWKQWRALPLLAEEIDEIGAVLEDRWLGRTDDITRFSEGLKAVRSLRPSLGFDDRPLWALYTSSHDESADVEQANAVFGSQYEWIDATVDIFARRADLQLAIRAHPNSGSRKSLGRNTQDAEYFAALEARLPANVRLIPADSPISSYELAVAANAGLVWFSTIGLEMAALGRTVVRIGHGPLASADFMPSPPERGVYPALIDEVVRAGEQADLARTVQAWRFAHVYFLRRSIAFPLVRQPRWFLGEMNYETAEALGPGRDASLDRICAIFTAGRPVHEPAPPRVLDLAQPEAHAIARRIAPYQPPNWR